MNALLAPLDRLLNELRSMNYAILCGSGISRHSGLPTGQQFKDAFLESVVCDKLRSIIRENLECKTSTSPLFKDVLAPLRFEGILDVWLKFDPQLQVLDAFRHGNPTTEHRALAYLAESHPVITTNFDSLIERSWRSSTEVRVAYTDDKFQAEPNHSGLYKIHGTLQRFINGSPENISSRDDGFPIATLRTIAGNMESIPRRNFIYQMRKLRPMLVIGYSGMDDFDVCRWLFEADEGKELIWIDYVPSASTAQVLSGQEAINQNIAPRPILRCKGVPHAVNKSTVVRTDSPVRVLVELSGQSFKKPVRDPVELDWRNLSSWQRSVVNALLLQLCRFRKAQALLRHVLTTMTLRPADLHYTEMCLAQALIMTGNFRKREKGLTYASRAVSSKCMDISSTLRANLLEIQAQFFTRRLSGHELGKKLVDLLYRANMYGEKELAADIAVFGKQQARTHAEMSTAFYAAETEGSLAAKGVRLHEDARKDWSRCRSPEELQTIITAMEQAIAFRTDLGDLPGLCASLAVCGQMYQRKAEWDNFLCPVYDKAMEQHERSLNVALGAGLDWHRSQALIDLAYISAKSAKLKKLATQLKQLEAIGDTLDESDRHHIMFLRGFRYFLGNDLSAARREFEEISALPDSKLGSRIRGAAIFNSLLCQAWAWHRAPNFVELPASHKGIRFWEQRIGCIGPTPLAAALLDSLPPSK